MTTLSAPQQVGQRVEVTQLSGFGRVPMWEGGGHIVAYVWGENTGRIVVQCDDGRIRFLSTHEVKVVDR